MLVRTQMIGAAGEMKVRYVQNGKDGLAHVVMLTQIAAQGNNAIRLVDDGPDQKATRLGVCLIRQAKS